MIVIAVAVGWIAGLLLGAENVPALPLIGLSGLAGVVSLRYRARPSFFWIFLALGASVLADLRYTAYALEVRENGVGGFTQRSVVRLRGVVSGDVTPGTIGDEFPFDVRELEHGGVWNPTEGTVLVRTRDPVLFRMGDRLEVASVLQQPDPLVPPRESRLRQEGVVAVAANPTVTPLGGWEWSPLAVIGRLREDAAASLNRSLPEPEAGLARGIALGQRRTFDPGLADDFARTNTSHILAVDGYKVGFIANLVDSVLALGLRLPFRAIGTIGGIALYTAFVGASPSALRAAIMGGIFAMGRALGRPRDTLNGLALAALVITAVGPFLLWSLAFQLSFVTTLGLAALAPIFVERLPHRIGFLREAIGTTIAAEIASAPLVVTAFDHVSLASLPVHAVVMPLLPFGIVLSGATAAIGMLAPPAGDAVGYLAWVPLAGIVAVVQWAGSLPIASVSIPPLGVGAVLVSYAVLGLALVSRPNVYFGPGLPLRDWARRVGSVVPVGILVPCLVVPTVLLAVFLIPTVTPVDRIHFLEVSGGDAALVTIVGGPTVYLGGNADATRVARAADPLLPLANRSIDVAVLSVDDDAALTGLTDLIGRLTVRRAIVPSLGFSDVALHRWTDALVARQVTPFPIDLVTDGEGPTIALGDRNTLVVYGLTGVPKQGRTAAIEPSLGARVTVGPATILWVSALPTDQARLVATGVPLAANVLKLVGRGSRWGLDPEFFRKVNPGIVVLPASVADRFARPTPGTLDLLANRRVYRTDLDGTVVITLGATEMRVETARGR